MKTQRTTGLAGLLLAGPVLAFAGTPEGTVEFSAAEGTKLVKIVTWTQELNLDEMGGTRAGSDLIRENVGGWLSSSMTKTFIDEYVKVGEGRPQVVRRLIRNAAGHGRVNLSGSVGRVEKRILFKSPMEGTKLLLTWIDDEGEYARLYDEFEAPERMLKDVTGDVDLLALLPSGEVAPGDSWEIEVSKMRDVLAPSGDIGLAPEDEGVFPRMMEVGTGGDLADVLGNRLTGSATATYSGEREVDGRQLAVIELKVDLESKRDRTGTYRQRMPREERQEASNLKHVTVTYGLVGTGELLWDLEAGHFDNFDLGGRETVQARVVKEMSEAGEVYETTQVITFSGELKLEYQQREMRRDEDSEAAAKKRAEKKAAEQAAEKDAAKGDKKRAKRKAAKEKADGGD